MKRLLGASLTIALATAFTLPAIAADLPEVKISPTNQVPECATPGRMMAYIRSRNPRVDPRFDSVATEYMRHGEQLGIRWDTAFFQMILETGALTYTGEVSADQNNFAGLGAAGRGQRGESFSDISSGVKAHLQHLLMYAGEHIDNPVADRTRKVQEWGILTDWQKSIDGPMTFTLLAQQWAPGSRGYVRDIKTIADRFYDGFCNQPDPQPELVQEARGGRAPSPDTQVAVAEPDPSASASSGTAATAAASTGPEARPPLVPEPDKGAQIAQRAIEEARNEDRPRSGLGAPGVLNGVSAKAEAATDQRTAAASPPEQPPAKPAAQASVTLINPSTPETTGPDASASAATTTPPQKPATADTTSSNIQTAAVAGAAAQLKVPEAKPSAKCKVWTASYGGQRAILIKAESNDTINYTVLDVNSASEKREVDAYIAAYAKGGQPVGAFASQAQALDKAFELCPEG